MIEHLNGWDVMMMALAFFVAMVMYDLWEYLLYGRDDFDADA